MGYGALVAVVLALFAEPLAGIFASGDEDAGYAAIYLRFVGLSLFGYGLVVTANAAMNARDKAVWSMSLSLGRIFFALYLPLAWVGALSMGYPGIIAAAVVANVIAGWAAVISAKGTGLLDTDNGLVTFPLRVLPQRA